MLAKERLFETTDGRLVREGDPEGAFLKFAPGDQVGTDWEDKVNRLTSGNGGGTGEAQAYHDTEVRDAMRVAQADPTAANRAVAAHAVHGDAGEPVLISDGLATELADEARSLANRGLSLVDGETVAAEQLFYTEDRDKLVKAGDTDGRYLAYAQGDKIKDKDLDAFELVSDDDDDDADTSVHTAAPSTPAKKATPAKATTAAANK